MIKSTYNRKKLAFGILLALWFACLANLTWDLGFFGRFERPALLLLSLIMGIAVFKFGTTKEEEAEYRRLRAQGRRD